MIEYKTINTIFFIALIGIDLVLYLLKFKKGFSLFISGVLLFLILSSRNLDSGLNDTLGTYYPIFSYTSRIDNIKTLLSSSYSSFTSPLFLLFTKAFSLFKSFRFYIVILSGIFVFSFQFFFNNFSKNWFASELFFITFIYPFGFFLMRQCLAMSLIAIAVILLSKKRKLSGILLMILSALIHTTAISFLLVFLGSLILKKMKKKEIMFLFFTLEIIILCFGKSIFSFAFSFLPSTSKYYYMSQFQVYKTGGLWLGPTIISFLMVSFSLIYYKNKPSVAQTRNNGVLILSCFYAFFYAFSIALEDLTRIGLYFSLALSILLPNILKTNSHAKRYSLFIYSCFIIYFFISVLPANNIAY